MATVVQSVERLVISIASGTLTGTADLGKSQIIGNCKLRVSWDCRVSSSAFGKSGITAALVPDDGDPDRVLITRADSSGICNVVVYVIEWKPANILTAMDSLTMAVDEEIVTVTIPDVGNINKAWPSLTYRGINNSPSISRVSIRLTATDEITLERQRDGTIVDIEWNVAYCLANEWLVHPFNIELASSVLETATIPAVDMGKTFLEGSIDTFDGSNIASFGGVSLELTSTTQATARRFDSNSNSLIVRGHAIECADSVSVRRFTKTLVNVATGTTDVDPPVPLAKAVPSFALNHPSARCNHVAAPSPYACVYVNQTADDTLSYECRGHGDVSPEFAVELTDFDAEDEGTDEDVAAMYLALLGATV